MPPPSARQGLRRYYRVHHARGDPTPNTFIWSEDTNNPQRPGAKVFWVGTATALFANTLQGPSSFYEVLGPGAVAPYGDIDIKVDTPLEDDAGVHPALEHVQRVGLVKADLRITEHDFTHREVQLGGEWLRRVVQDSFKEVLKTSDQLTFRWTAGSRPNKFSHHFLIANVLMDSAPVAPKSAIVDVGVKLLVKSFDAVSSARDKDTSAGLATPGGQGDSDFHALTRFQLRVLQLRKWQPHGLLRTEVLDGAVYSAINQNMRCVGSGKARVSTAATDNGGVSKVAVVGVPLSVVKDADQATHPELWPPAENVSLTTDDTAFPTFASTLIGFSTTMSALRGCAAITYTSHLYLRGSSRSRAVRAARAVTAIDARSKEARQSAEVGEQAAAAAAAAVSNSITGPTRGEWLHNLGKLEFLIPVEQNQPSKKGVRGGEPRTSPAVKSKWERTPHTLWVTDDMVSVPCTNSAAALSCTAAGATTTTGVLTAEETAPPTPSLRASLPRACGAGDAERCSGWTWTCPGSPASATPATPTSSLYRGTSGSPTGCPQTTSSARSSFSSTLPRAQARRGFSRTMSTATRTAGG